MQEHKNEKKNIWTSIFSLSWDYVLNHHHAIGYQSCFYSCSIFFKKAAIIIATHGQKSLHWHLSRYMYNCNFEAVN